MKIFIFLLLAVVCTSRFYRDLRDRIRIIRQGAPDDRSGDARERLSYFFKTIFLHKRIGRFPLFGCAHMMILWGFVVMMAGNLDLIATGLFSVQGLGTSLFYCYVRDIFMVIVLAGLSLCLVRRLVVKPAWLKNNIKHFEILIYIFVIVISEFAYYAAQASLNGHSTVIVGAFASLFSGFSPKITGWLGALFWWTHFGVTFYFLTTLPGSKHLHLLFAPVNTYRHRTTPMGMLPPAAPRPKESGGTDGVETLTWKLRLDAFSCVRCGRCDGNCPAHLSDEDLKPKRINGRLRKLIEPTKIVPTKKEIQEPAKSKKKKKNPHPKTIGDILSQEALWSCAACGACMAACPISCEHLSAIIGMRRYLVSEAGPLPAGVKKVLGTIEQSGSPWPVPKPTAPDSKSTPGWAEGLDVRPATDHPNAEYLYFPGCAACADDAARKTARAFTRLLFMADIDFAVMPEGYCCADTARRLGHEALFQEAAKGNIRLWKNLGVKKIIATCPHCYNTLKHEYSQLGGDAQIIAHPVFLEELLRDGRLVPQSCDSTALPVTIHDPCYLGRFNGIYKEVRRILYNFPEVEIVEMSRNKEDSFCCGSGGGRFWTMENANPIRSKRMAEAKATGAKQIVTTCPYCQIGFQNENTCEASSGPLPSIDLAQFMARRCIGATG